MFHSTLFNLFPYTSPMYFSQTYCSCYQVYRGRIRDTGPEPCYPRLRPTNISKHIVLVIRCSGGGFLLRDLVSLDFAQLIYRNILFLLLGVPGEVSYYGTLFPWTFLLGATSALLILPNIFIPVFHKVKKKIYSPVQILYILCYTGCFLEIVKRAIVKQNIIKLRMNLGIHGFEFAHERHESH